MKVLVTDGDERVALAVTRSLARTAEVHVAAVGRTSLAGSSRRATASHCLPDPVRAPAEFARGLQALAAALRAEAVLPLSDAAIQALLPGREALAPCVLIAPARAPYERLSDKAEVAALAQDCGLAVPEGGEAASAAEGLVQAERVGWPVFLKPSVSVSGDGATSRRRHGVERVEHAGAFPAAWERAVGAGRALVQRCVPGWGEGLFLLRTGGTTRAVFAHRRLREKPPAGGVSVLRESIAVDPQRQRAVEDLLDRVGFEGVAMAEFKADGRTAWLMEFNARLWGSLQLAIDAGADFPRYLLDAALGRPLPASPPPVRLGVRSRWLLGDLDHALALLRGRADPAGRRGPGAALSVLLRPAGPDCRWEVLRRDDPRPFLHELRRWLRDARGATRGAPG